MDIKEDIDHLVEVTSVVMTIKLSVLGLVWSHVILLSFSNGEGSLIYKTNFTTLT